MNEGHAWAIADEIDAFHRFPSIERDQDIRELFNVFRCCERGTFFGGRYWAFFNDTLRREKGVISL